MKKYRRFKKEDWFAWAGAERFGEKKDPFIYERTLNEGEVELTIIADKWGIGVYFSTGDDDCLIYQKSIEGLNSIRAEGELSHLIDYLEKYDYAPDITYELDHPSDATTQGFMLTEY